MCYRHLTPHGYDPALSSVLKALHAQMDARALAAPQKNTGGPIRPTRSSSPSASIFRRGTGARRGVQERERIGKFGSAPARAGTSISSPDEFE